MSSRLGLRKQKKNRIIVNRICKIVGGLLVLSTMLFIYKLFQMNLLTAKYVLPILSILMLFDGIVLFLLINGKIKLKFKMMAIVFMLIISTINIIGYNYMDKAISFIDALKPKGYKTENYSVIVLSDSDINSLDDLKNKMVSYVKTFSNSSIAMEELKKKADFVSNNVTDIGELISGLLNKNLTAIMVEDSYIEMLQDQYLEEGKDFNSLIKKIDTFKIEIKEEKIVKEINVTEDAFVLYISGIDIAGDISTVSRSDVNIVAVINLPTKQVLLISIPRDYYVKLHGIDTTMKDKLTHAGMYGIDTSVKTIEDLLDIDINYYLKVNFTSLVDLVNALDGVDVNSKYSFKSYKYYYKKGINHLNGVQALYFCRERKSFSGGDRVRGQNQQAVISAIINKIATPSIITNYSNILKSIEGKFETNMGTDNINKLIKMQINDMATWNVKSISLDGYNSSNYSYSYPQSMGNAKNYVMEPNLETIKEAQNLIRDIKGNLLVDSTDTSKTYATYNTTATSSTNSIKSSSISSSSLSDSKSNSSASILFSSSKNSNISSSNNSSIVSSSLILSSSVGSLNNSSITSSFNSISNSILNNL